jgi:hypothetical protein
VTALFFFLFAVNLHHDSVSAVTKAATGGLYDVIGKRTSATTQQVTLTGLTDATTYDYEVRSITGAIGAQLLGAPLAAADNAAAVTPTGVTDLKEPAVTPEVPLLI